MTRGARVGGNGSTIAVLPLFVALTAGCSSSSDMGKPGSDMPGDGSVPLGETLNGCAPGAYEDKSADQERIIAIASAGLVFTPKCMLITVGQSVRWEGSLTAHPLAPGNESRPTAGSANSPIVPTASGTSVTFTFPTAGVYPYWCQMHSFGDGMGMAGSIMVR